MRQNEHQSPANLPSDQLHTNDELDQHTPTENLERLLNELNLLKLEGCLFCFDPKEASRRRGTRTVDQVERFQEIVKRPVSVKIDPDYGQPSVLAYKVLQAVFRKATDEGWPIPEVISFSQRELAALTGRSSWGGADGKQFYRAVMQLQTALIRCSWYDKTTTEWGLAAFNVFPVTLFSGRGERLTACSVQLNPLIHKSLNNKHFACFNWNRMRGLEPIGMALYKRLAFHFANVLGSYPRDKRERLLYSPQVGKELVYAKDYEDILAEWLGGLKPAKFKAVILRDQLGRHLEGLRKARLIQRYELEKKADGEGWKITFYAGRGFFADYEAFYVRQWQPQLRFQQTADRRNIEQPLELVALFHKHLGHDQNTFETKETLYASQLLDQFTFEEAREFIGFTIETMRSTGFDQTVRLFTAAKLYEGAWRAEKASLTASKARRKRIEECPLCDSGGFLFVRQPNGARAAAKCKHDPAWLKTFLQANGLERDDPS
jgi:hypothetical protein